MTLPLRTHILFAAALWSALLLAAPPAANAGQILGAPTYMGLNSGLVGFWTFDGKDTAGSITYDRSGQGNNGTLTNGVVRGLGNTGQAMEFDGVDDIITFTTTSDGLNNLGPMTVSLWVRPRTFGEQDPGATIISKGDQECFGSIADGWALGIAWANGNPGELCFQMGFASRNLQAETVQDILTLNQWQHVVVSWDGTIEADNVLFYRNAVAAATAFKEDGIGLQNDDSARTLNIGGESSDATMNFDGSVDEVRIYNRQLSADEIKRLYKIGSTFKLGAPNNTGSLSQGLVGWWTFDGNDIFANNRAYDRSGQGNTGTLTGTPARTIGKVGQGLDFDSSDGVSLGTGASIGNLTRKTIAFWVMPTSWTTFGAFVESFDGGSSSGWYVELCNSDGTECPSTARTFAFWSGNGGALDFGEWYAPANSIPLNQWHHIAVTFDCTLSSNDPILYLDGQRVTATESVTPGGSLCFNDSAVAKDMGTVSGQSAIDDLRIYNRQLSPDEIKRLYKMGSTLKQGVASSNGSLSQGLVGWWTMDGADTSVNNSGVVSVTDRSGNGNAASSTTGTNPARTFGKIGQGMEFDSGSNILSAGHPSLFTNITQKTVCAWIKPTSFSTRDIVAKYNTGGNGGWLFRLGSNCDTGQDLCYFNRFSASNGYWSTSGGITLNDWNHACVTYDNSSTSNDPELYINGVSKAVTETIGPPSGTRIDDTGTDLTIGNLMNAGEANAFGGTIDDVRLYNRFLSSDEIRRLYNMGR